MTENQNSNADGERPTPTPGNGQDSDTSSKSSTPGAAGQATTGADTPQSHDMNDLDAAWAAFEAEHQADLHDVASSRQAKKFEKQAKKREKEALLSVDDLDIGSRSPMMLARAVAAKKASSQVPVISPAPAGWIPIM